jgi:hypothetical protein
VPKKDQKANAPKAKKVKSKVCKHCGRPDSVGFSLWEESNPFIQKFQFKRKLKFGDLVACPLCESFFIKLKDPRDINSDMISLDFISNEDLQDIEVWESKNLTPTPKQKKILKKIQATPPDIYTNGSEYIQFPCKCILKDGRVLELCILQFRRTPPQIEEKGEIIYLDQVKEILESEYTLSPKVRFATTQAEEIRMSYAPTVVKLPKGGKYVFNWTNHFFATQKVKGKDIVTVLDESPYDIEHASEKQTGKFLELEIHYVYAYWDSDLIKFELK